MTNQDNFTFYHEQTCEELRNLQHQLDSVRSMDELYDILIQIEHFADCAAYLIYVKMEKEQK